ncbi:MAG: nitrogenase component I subunit alpha [Intestinibacillus sp.]
MNPREIVLDKYSARVYKNRKEHILTIPDDGAIPQLTANSRTLPGIITERGCCYAGCKGVVVGPIKDVVTITHGPIGCGYYAWGTRRNKARPGMEGEPMSAADMPMMIQYMFSTDMQEPNIVFGGEKKLRKACEEAVEIFHPKAILICATCPIGLIGDDIHAVAAAVEKDLGVTCIAFSCEGYKGVSQSAGHHIANNQVMRRIIGTGSRPRREKYMINVLGEYNIGGDGFYEEELLKKCGIHIRATLTGNVSIEELASAHEADLNVVMCHRSINYIAELMQTKYGIDWLKVNFIGIEATKKSLRDIANYFGDQALIDRVEEVIAEEEAALEEQFAYYRRKLTGKTAALYVGGSRSHHYQLLLGDFGVSTVLAGYEFAHRDDYEGRDVIPTIKLDADGKNIESITVEPDAEHFKTFLTEEGVAKLRAEHPEIELNDYRGMMADMNPGAIVDDDLNHYETEEFIKLLKPDVFFTGIKDKYAIQKTGTLCRQLHSYEYSGPYSCFKGAAQFGHDLVMSLYTPARGMAVPPWKSKATIHATVGGGN